MSLALREVQPIRLTALERVGAYVDRAIGLFAPAWGLRRLQARAATKALGAYRGADRNRLRGDWTALNGSADADLLPDLPTLRQRSRDLNRNDAHASAITSTVVVNVIGTGLKPQSRPDVESLGVSADAAKQFTKQAERAWKIWVRTADSQNRMSFEEIQALVQRQILENGDVFVLPLMIADDPRRRYRLALEVVEADRVSTPPGMANGTIRDGVELGARGEPVAYHIRTRHPGDWALGPIGTGASAWRRYPAFNKAGRQNVLHLYHVKRPGQTRGEPFFAPVLAAFKDLADFMEAEIVAARVAACFSAFVTKNDPAAEYQGLPTNSAGQRLEGIEPGMIQYLNSGESVQFGDPKRPSGTFEPFVLAVLRSIGASLGLPLELVLKDFSRTNYSSARAAMIEARRFFKGYQAWIAQRLCQPCWEWLIEEAWLREDVPAVDLFGDQREDWLRALWIAPGWGWVDPVKEVESSRSAIDAKLSTLADECAAQGRDWEEVLIQRQREQEKMRELGLTLPEESNREPAQPAGETVDEPMPGAPRPTAEEEPVPA
jgi:lambda family phage portal protein